MTLVLAAAGTASIALLGDVVEGGAILAIVVLNMAVSIGQQRRADTALAALKQLTSPLARVEREGRAREVPAREVVVGDRILVAAGDRIPADVSWVEAHDAACDESMLTGESLSVKKDTHKDAMGWAGTLMVRGRAVGIVTATGARSKMGAIASKLGASPPAPLERQLRVAARRITIAALGAGVALVALVLVRHGTSGTTWSDALLAAVALAVAAVPEGLLAVVTLALAVGVHRMAKRGAIVRHLKAIETLGAASVLCVDKTGTLTEGRLGVTEAWWLPGKEDALWAAAQRCIDVKDATGDPIDVAISVEATRLGVARPEGVRVAEVPFDPTRRAMWTIHEAPAGPSLSVKGAPETILALCKPGAARDELKRACNEALGHGRRVLAFASAKTRYLDARDLQPLGFIAFADPVRTTAARAIEACRHGGIEIVMVTGDHPGTAQAIGRVVGLDPSRTVEGAALAALPASAQRRALADASIVARVEPDTKVELVDAHREQGRVVAMMGDGVNDAPALRRADIGVAVAGAGGTDVAREAAAIVLTSGDLGTLVEAVREGRRIYNNLVAVVTYLLAGNVSEVIVVLAGTALFPELIVMLAPVQLLWVNLVTDGPPALALGTDHPPGDPLARPPRNPSEQLLGWPRFLTLGFRGAVVGCAVLATGILAKLRGASAGEIQSQVFLSLIGCHLTLAYLSRAGGPWQAGWSRNRVLLLTLLVTLAVQVLVLEVPWVRGVFGLSPVDAIAYAVAGATAGSLLVADAVARRLMPDWG